MPDLLLGESDDAVAGMELVRRERDDERLTSQSLAVELGKARSRAYEAEEKAAKAQEQTRLLGERLSRLESVTASAFARSVRTLSSSRGQLGRAVEADRVVLLVEEHLDVTRFLVEHEVPGDKLLQRVRWLHDKATQTIVQETAEFFSGVDLGFPGPDRSVVVEVRGDSVSVVDEGSPTIPAPALPPKP